MKKIALAAAISTIVAAPAFAASYHSVFTSGTPADQLAAFSIVEAYGAAAWYVDTSSGTASSKTTPAISKSVASDWTFDFTDLSAVAFTGTLEMGDFKVQSTVRYTPTVIADGRLTYTGVKYTFSGIGSYDEATNTFTYSFFNSTINNGKAATYSETAPATCENGTTSLFGKICSTFSTTSKNWEGLALNFVFKEDRSNFEGSLQGMQTNGSGVTRNTTTINWSTQEVPVPGAAWLFGSGLLALAGARRRRGGGRDGATRK